MKKMLGGILVLATGLYGQPAAKVMLDSSASAATRNEACRQLGAADLPALEAALADEAVRACAADALRRFAAAEPLLRAARQGAPAARACAAQELGLMKVPAALDVLVAAAKDSDPLVSGSALYALLGFEDPRVLDTLLELAARQGVSSLAAVNSLGRFRDPRVSQVLYGLLGARDLLLRLAAIGALGEVGNAGAVEHLDPLLADATTYRAAQTTGIGLFPAVNLARAAQVAIERIRAREANDAGR